MSSTNPRALPPLVEAVHRPWFLLGLTSALASMAWWLLFWLAALYRPEALSAPPVTPAHVHGLLMSHGLLGFFIFGFLSTVFPRWQDQPAVPRRSWLPGVIAAALGLGLTLLGLAGSRWVLVAGVLALTLAHALASWPLLRIFLAAGERRVMHGVASLLGLLGGLGALLVFAWGAAAGDAALTGAAVRASVWLYLLPIFAAVGHRMIPFFSGRVVEGYERVRPPLPLALILAGAFGHTLLGWAGLPAWQWGPDLLAAGAAGWLTLAWQPLRCLRPPLLGWLHIGFAWLPVSLALSGAQSLGLLLTGSVFAPQAPLHALTVGFFGTLMVAMVTRVSLGHSGRPLVMSPLARLAAVGMQGVALLRIAAELPATAGMRWSLILAAAGLWLVVTGLWGVAYGPIYLRPRADGKPG